MKRVGARIKELRRAKQLKQSQLAIVSDVNVYMISDIERGKSKKCAPRFLVRLARGLDVNVDAFFMSADGESFVNDTPETTLIHKLVTSGFERTKSTRAHFRPPTPDGYIRLCDLADQLKVNYCTIRNCIEARSVAPRYKMRAIGYVVSLDDMPKIQADLTMRGYVIDATP